MTMLDVSAFSGVHCESTTMVNLLSQRGIDISEAMVFGLGRGLDYIYWKSKLMPYPFIGGRVKPDKLTEFFSENLDITIIRKETGSIDKAWQNLVSEIDAGNLVGLKLDSYFLEYCSETFHFPSHYLTCYGYDNERVYLIDSMGSEERYSTSRDSLSKARSFKGPMSSKSLSYTLAEHDIKFDLEEVIPKAITQNSESYLNPPIKNMSFKGICKTSEVMKDWLTTLENPKENLASIAYIMEHAGTGGGLFRKLWATYLQECSQIITHPGLDDISARFFEIGEAWSQVSNLLENTAELLDKRLLLEASSILLRIAEDEKSAMKDLHSLVINKM
ncbi:BtrH N-terminal domain-containing protein [Shewanella woodyi]|uniref:Butirosin biosynthesis protein H N-terminal domain-containing protein n=1 Tax=Shewanella woodyi (strain ATCC 51908 / MS32) TaxID=392500 RepID=B1KQQ6_SHEWM|nr:BtrH N-terminal domain-containing protein [Shewanella woodyi]ACA86295.1 conserved hypothetical protein [Shewanella woodyi ATCC 51908]